MAKKKQQSFEEGLNRMEEIAKLLEVGQENLEDSISLYKEGIELSKYCLDKLNSAEKQVLTLQKNLDGDFVTEYFEIEEN